MQVDDTAADTTTFNVQASAGTSIPLDGIYYWFNLAGANFAAGTADLVPADNAAPSKVSLAGLPAGSTHYADATVKSIRISGKGKRRSNSPSPRPRISSSRKAAAAAPERAAAE